MPVQKRLSDGRAVRLLDGKFNQEQMFSLKGKLPAHETIMNLREIDDAINVDEAHRENFRRHLLEVRSSSYAVHARGYERDLDMPVGDKVVWVENGVSYTFEVPDVRHPLEPDRALSEATGLLDFDLACLQYDEGRKVVSVTTDFDPERNVRVVDVMRPNGWALTDANGYPLRTEPSSEDNPEARICFIKSSDVFKGGATGWHGSMTHGALGSHNAPGQYIINIMGLWWNSSQVALVERKATG